MKKVFILLTFLLIKNVFVSEVTKETLDYYRKSYENSIYQSKMVSCLSVVQLSIADNNKDFQTKISTTTLDKTKFYYKYIMAMMNNCLKTITQEYIDIIITLQNLKYEQLPLGVQELIMVKADIDDVELTQEEQEIMNEINVIVEKNKQEVKKAKANQSFFDRNLKKIVIGSLLLMAFVIYINFRGMNKEKKPSDPKEFEAFKEVIEAKQRNKPKKD